VPQTIAEIIFAKLGQSPIPLLIPVEFFKIINSHRAL
jgi:hypothetical protein